MKTFNKISYIPEFKKDLKKLSKRFRTLEEDLNIFIKSQLKIYHLRFIISKIKRKKIEKEF